MIDHIAARAGLAAVLTAGLPDITVQPGGVDATVVLPCVVVGQPSWTPQSDLPYGLDRTSWPVAAVVPRSGEDSETIGTLDDLWPRVVQVLRTATEQDPTLGGICSESLVTRADFGQFGIQGTNYPAQLCFLELYG